MDTETLGKIFEPFFTTKEAGLGTGMRLAMVYGFVAQSGGFIQVDSKQGTGPTFRLYFPLVRGVVTPTEATPTPKLDTLPHGTETLLVVEDEEAVRDLFVSVLRECGYTVLEAGNATEALPLGEYYEDKIDLLVTDVVMPKMNGIELSERLRSVRPDLAVLLVSDYPNDAAPRNVLMNAEADILTKPVDDMTLASTVRRTLDAARSTKHVSQ